MCISPPTRTMVAYSNEKSGPGWKEKDETMSHSEETQRIQFADLWDHGRLQTGRGHTGSICSVTTGEGLAFSGSYDGTVRVWSATTGAAITRLTGHQGAVLCLAVSGLFLYSGSDDGTIRAWRITDGLCLSSIQCRRGAVWSLAVNDSGTRLYSGMKDGAILVWSTPIDGEPLKAIHVLTAHRGPVYSLVIGGDCLYSSAADRLIKVWFLGIQRQWSLGTSGGSIGSPVPSPRSVQSPPRSPRFSPPISPNSSRLGVPSGSFQGSPGPSSASAVVCAWSMRSGDGKGLRSPQRTQSAQDFTSAPSSPQMHAAHRCFDRPVPVAIYEGHADEVLSLCFYGGILFSGDAAGVVRVWESWRRKPIMPNVSGREEGPCLLTMKSGGRFVRALAVNGDALYVGGQDIEVWWWSEQCGRFELERTWSLHQDHVVALAVSKAPPGLGGVTLVSGGMDHDLRMWWMKSAFPTTATCQVARASHEQRMYHERAAGEPVVISSGQSCAPCRTRGSSSNHRQQSSNHWQQDAIRCDHLTAHQQQFL